MAGDREPQTRKRRSLADFQLLSFLPLFVVAAYWVQIEAVLFVVSFMLPLLLAFQELTDTTKGLLFLSWYTYDNQGNPIFLLGNGIADGYNLEIQFESPRGMEYGEFDPDDVVRADGGTALFNFSDPDNGTFSYTPSGFSTSTWGHTTPIDSLPLVKLFAIPVSGSEAATN